MAPEAQIKNGHWRNEFLCGSQLVIELFVSAQQAIIGQFSYMYTTRKSDFGMSSLYISGRRLRMLWLFSFYLMGL